jgi:toxin ParE1/3/4
MNFQLRTRPEADRDLIEARAWYERQSPLAAERFHEAIEAIFASITEGPLKYRAIHKGVRRALTGGFPYAVFFTLREETIFVIAVTHQARHAREWRRRA